MLHRRLHRLDRMVRPDGRDLLLHALLTRSCRTRENGQQQERDGDEEGARLGRGMVKGHMDRVKGRG